MKLEKIIQIRLTDEDLEELKKLAEIERLCVSSYCRKELFKKIKSK